MASLSVGQHLKRREWREWREWGGKSAHEKMTIKIGSFRNVITDNLHQFMKDRRYVDVTLKTDDGREFPCHRCVLASSSNYFDAMFSNGMRESRESVISVSDVSSSVLSHVLDFLYKMECQLEYVEFFDLLLVANMFEIKALESSLVCQIRDLSPYAHTVDKSDFLLQTWVFCQDYPIIADSLVSLPEPSYSNSNYREKPFAQYVVEKLRSSSWSAKLAKSESFLELNEELFSKMFLDSEISDFDAAAAFGWVTKWMFHSKPSRVKDDSDPDSRFLHTKRFLDQLDLAKISVAAAVKMREETKYDEDLEGDVKNYFDYLESVRREQRQLLIMPLQEEGGVNRFIAHDVLTGSSFSLESPDIADGFEVIGTPQLLIDDRYGEKFLYCFQGVRKFPAVGRKEDSSPCFLRHRFSFTTKKWVPSPDPFVKRPPRILDEAEQIPLNNQAFLIPSHIPSISRGIPCLRLSHDYQVEKEAIEVGEEEQKEQKEQKEREEEKGKEKTTSERIDGEVPSCSKKSEVTTAESKGAREIVYSDRPGRNIVEVMRGKVADSADCYASNMWKCLVPNLEVTGFGSYTRHDENLGVVVFGNSYTAAGTKEALALCGSQRTKMPCPDGAADVPHSVVSFGDYLFVLASAPFTAPSSSKSKTSSKATVKLPRLWLFKPHMNPDEYHFESQWTEIPTPSFPDIDYAAIYYDPSSPGTGSSLRLVLVQTPKSETVSPTAARGRSKAVRKSKRKSEAETKSTSATPDRRLVCFFQLKPTPMTIFSSNGLESFERMWHPLAVSEKTADFFSLGCRLPGEVRITAALINSAHLTRVNLSHEGNGVDDEVSVVANPSIPAVLGPRWICLSSLSRPRWVTHQESAYRGFTHCTLEKELKKRGRRGSFQNNVKRRKLIQPLPAQATPASAHPTISFKSDVVGETGEKKDPPDSPPASPASSFTEDEERDDEDEDSYYGRGYGCNCPACSLRMIFG